MNNNKNIVNGVLIVGFLINCIIYADETASNLVQEEEVINQIDIPEHVEIKSKDIKMFAAIWQRIAYKINEQYDKEEYPEIAKFTAKVSTLKKRSADEDLVILNDKKAHKLVSAWEDVELLLLSAPRANISLTEDGKRTITTLDAYDLAKARRFVARIKEHLHYIEFYRIGNCIGGLSAKINLILETLGNCSSDQADPLDCTYLDVTSLMADINALCPIVTLLRTILAELRGVGPGPAYCP